MYRKANLPIQQIRAISQFKQCIVHAENRHLAATAVRGLILL